MKSNFFISLLLLALLVFSTFTQTPVIWNSDTAIQTG